ncbi:MAG: two-component regulator propeller domain-containing protein [Anaerolineae bacterium]
MLIVAKSSYRLLGLFICTLLLFGSLKTTVAQDAPADVAQDVSQLRFSHVSTENGLSQSTVLAIYQDSRGFIWIGTQFGLNRFDGYSIKTYQYDPTDITSLSGNNIVGIVEDFTGHLWIYAYTTAAVSRYNYETDDFTRFGPGTDLPGNLTTNVVVDSQGGIWLGTDGGLAKFDELTQHFSWYLHHDDDANSLVGDHVVSLKLDSQDNLWIATTSGISQLNAVRDTFHNYPAATGDSNGLLPPSAWSYAMDVFLVASDGGVWIGTEDGLDRLDSTNGHIDHFTYAPDDADGLPSTDVYALYEDHSHRVWVATHNTVSVYNPTTKTFESYTVGQPTAAASQTLGISTAIFQDSYGTLWISGGAASGLHRFNEQTQQFEAIENNPTDEYAIGDDKINSFYEDRSGILWIGTNSAGAAWLDLNNSGFALYQHIPGNTNSLSTSYIYSIYQDRSGIVWVGGDDGVLNRFDRSQNRITHYEPNESNPQALTPSFSISALLEDSQNTFWVGTYGGGLHIMDRETGTFERFRADGQPGSLASDSVLYLLEDSHHNLWVGTAYPSALQRFDYATRTFVNADLSPDSLVFTGEGIRVIYEDIDGILWLGGWSDGLFRYDPQNDSLTVYQHADDDPASLSNNSVYSIGQASNGDLWIGTANGLNKLDRETNTFTVYTKQDGLPDSTIYGLLPDSNNQLWLSSNRGLAGFDPVSVTVTSYTDLQNVQGMEFNQTAYFESASGEMFFGGTNGVNAFYPQNVRVNPYVPPVAVTSLTVFNEPVPITGDGILRQNIVSADQITLQYTDSVFSFEFASLAYANPNLNRYRYRLVGFDENWNEVNSQHRFATYTNIPGGAYTFQVQGSNEMGIWNDVGASITVTIIPAWWDTLLFRVSAFMAVLGAVALYFTQRTRSVRLRAEQLQHVVDERTRDLKVSSLVSQQIITVLDRTELLSQVVELVQRSFGLYQVSIFLVDPSDSNLKLRAASGEIGKRMLGSKKQFSLAEPRLGIVPSAAYERKPIVRNNVLETPTHLPNPLLPDTRSEAAFPIIFGAELMGVLDLQSQTLNRFSPADIEIFLSLANKIAVAIRNAALFEEVQEARLRAEQSDAAKSAFLASTSHELRTPLNAIINLTSFMKRGLLGEISPRQTEVLGLVMKSGEGLLALINDVLDMSKIESGALKLYIEPNIDLQELIKGAAATAETLLEGKPVKMTVKLADDIPSIAADKHRVQQILLNILSNACKFTEKGEIRIEAIRNEREVQIFIHDTGPGIAKDDFTKVFQKFTQTESGLRQGGGTGLGMPITKSLVEAHGGRIWLESEVGVGSTFHFTLPIIHTSITVALEKEEAKA